MEETTISRRTFAVGAMVAGSAVVLGGTFSVSAAAADQENDKAPVSDQYGFLVDMNKCVGCEKCVTACRTYNRLSEDTPNRRVVSVLVNSFGEDVFISTSCMHCDEPNCMRVCPAGAISKGEAGIVSVDKQKCIGCKYCFQACPYGVPHYNSVAMDKCDCCLDAGIEPGQTPYCVQACIFNALTYGPIDELIGTARSRGLAVEAVGKQCDPNCFLVGEVG